MLESPANFAPARNTPLGRCRRKLEIDIKRLESPDIQQRVFGTAAAKRRNNDFFFFWSRGRLTEKEKRASETLEK